MEGGGRACMDSKVNANAARLEQTNSRQTNSRSPDI